VFDRIWIDCLNGDKYKTGKVAPDGSSDPSIFSTESDPEGIQVGTAIALLVRKKEHEGADIVRFRHLWGKEKRAILAQTAEQDRESLYEEQTPPLGLGLPFVPIESQADYPSWPLLPELFPTSFSGVQTRRDELVVDTDRDRLVDRMKQYFDPTISDEQMGRICARAMESTAQYDPKSVREYLSTRGFLPQYIVRYCYRPFDIRWLYWEPETGLLGRKVPDYFAQVLNSNKILFTTGRTRKSRVEPAFSTRLLSDLNFMDSGARGIPLYLRPAERELSEGDNPETPVTNITESAAQYLREISVTEEDLFFHCLAITHSLAFRWENTDSLRLDWPRIPLPDLKEALTASAALGREVAALLDTERPVIGVTSGRIRRELRALASPSRVGGGALDPESGDLRVTAGWGYKQNGAVMAGQGRAVERDYTPEERAAVGEGAKELGIHAEQAFARLGESTFDVHLNGTAYWSNVPARVWSYTMGGYQVIKKWLSYREEEILGRPLDTGEVRAVRDIARRIAALLLLEPLLDENYEAVKSSYYPWTGDR